MAQVKRPAEKAIVSQPKRQKSARKGARPTDDHPNQGGYIGEVNPSESQGDGVDGEEVVKQLTTRLSTLKEQADQRKTWAKNFETRVNAQHADLLQKIEDAKTRLKTKREAFITSMIPALASAMSDFHLELDPQTPVELPLQIEIKHSTKALTEASKLFESCETLIACYDQMTVANAPPSSIPESRQKFAEGSEALTRAFHAAKRMTYNQAHSHLVDKLRGVREPYSLTAKDEALARKVLEKGTSAQERNHSKDVGLGHLTESMSKVVDMMQNVIEH